MAAFLHLACQRQLLEAAAVVVVAVGVVVVVVVVVADEVLSEPGFVARPVDAAVLSFVGVFLLQ